MDTLLPEGTQQPQASGGNSSLKYLYYLIGLVVLIIILEGGYFLYLHQKKTREKSSEARPVIDTELIREQGQIILEGIQDDLQKGKLIGDAVLFKGKIEKIEGRTVEMFAETSNFPILVRVEVFPDAVFFKSGDSAQGGWEILEGDHFNDIKVGSYIVFSDVLPGENNHFSSKKVIFEE